jgi:flagellar hook-length control protein FliK
LKMGSKSLENTMSLEEIRARDRKRREEEERKRREAEERRRKEEEAKKAEQAKAEQEAKDKAAAEQAKAEEPKTAEKQGFGTINEAPIKDILGKVYAMYQVGFAKVDVTNMTMAASFKIEKDGSITNIVVYKSSGDKYIDTQAKAVLHNLGESHALTPLAILTSNSIQLELTEKNSRLSIIGFAPNPAEAKRLATDLNGLFFLLRMTRKSDSRDVAELMSMMKVTYSGNRVEANLNVSRDRAAEMMKNKFGNSGAQ